MYKSCQALIFSRKREDTLGDFDKYAQDGGQKASPRKLEDRVL
jgi:hypothetical protein